MTFGWTNSDDPPLQGMDTSTLAAGGGPRFDPLWISQPQPLHEQLVVAPELKHGGLLGMDLSWVDNQSES